jgi:hypothetical protein
VWHPWTPPPGSASIRQARSLPTNSSENTANGGPGVTAGWRQRVKRVISGGGAVILVVSLPLTWILFGGALYHDGVGAALFVLGVGLLPVTLGVWMVRVGTPDVWRRPVSLRAALGLPGGVGLAIGLASVVLILLLPRAGFVIAFTALCIYPLLDAPRTVTRPSWWAGALVSALVWVVVFGTVAGTLDSVRRLREDSMVFLLPFMMYPLVLVISGLVRLEGSLRGRPRASSARLATILGLVACALLVGVPVTMNMIPAVMEKITGNTPANTAYSGDGEVLAAGPGRVDVRLGGARTESLRLTPETRFGFLGPGWRTVEGPGPAWLKAGQRVNVEYFFRGGEAQAQYVAIWIDRKGCAGDAKWGAASRAAAPSPGAISGLTGTTWDGRRGSGDAPGAHAGTLFEFLDGDRLAYTDRDGNNVRYTDAAWKQAGAAVLIQVNDCYAEYEGHIEGDAIKGLFTNVDGAREIWTARRNPVSVSATVPR